MALPTAAPTRASLGRRIVRYSVASLSGTIVGQGTLVLGIAVLDWPGVLANLVAVTLGTIPNYLINRYWTWQRAGRERLGTEATIFWILALIGLVVSTVFVAYADHRWGGTLAVAAAQMAGFGVLWVAKFLFLDRVLYRAVEEHHPSTIGS